MDLDSARVFPSKFSSVSRTSLSSVHSFLVPCLVHPTEMAFGMVKSLPKMMALLIFVHTIKEFVKVCLLIMKSTVVIQGQHKTSVQMVDFELFISVQVHTTPFCTSIQKGSDCPAFDLYGEDCSCIIANGGGVDFMNTGISFNVLVVPTGIITWFVFI